METGTKHPLAELPPSLLRRIKESSRWTWLVLLLAALYCWQTRYEFVHTNGRLMVGDRWTGCIGRPTGDPHAITWYC